jgi:phage tail-like protein
MAQPRSDGTPYGAFNFRVTAENFGGADSITAGFQEISGLGMEVTIADYRAGNSLENHVRHVPGLHKVNDVTLKRGVIGVTDLFTWIKSVSDGEAIAQQPKTVTIELRDETGHNTVMTWTLSGAIPKSYKGATLNAKGGTDVAIEELVLSVEGILTS